MKYYIYKLTNKTNGKIYIGFHGSNKDFLEDNYYGSGVLIRKAVEKYGKENFDREVLYVYESEEEAKEMERNIVNEDFLNRKDIYNLALGGSGGGLLGEKNPFFGKSHSEETLQILREKGKERTHTKETKEKISNSVKSSEKHKATITPERSKKIIETRRKNHPKKEKVKKTKETRKKVVHWWQDKVNKNPEKIEKTAAKHRGMKRSEETKKNVSESLKGLLVGERNGWFKGYYITPYGKFNSLESASVGTGFSKICIRDRCCAKNDNIVKLISVAIDKTNTLTKDMVGKTWKELGWSFEEVNKDEN